MNEIGICSSQTVLIGRQLSCGNPVMDPSTPYPVIGRSSPSETNTAYGTGSGEVSLFFTYLTIKAK
jgi:hypothetical protein